MTPPRRFIDRLRSEQLTHESAESLFDLLVEGGEEMDETDPNAMASQSPSVSVQQIGDPTTITQVAPAPQLDLSTSSSILGYDGDPLGVNSDMRTTGTDELGYSPNISELEFYDRVYNRLVVEDEDSTDAAISAALKSAVQVAKLHGSDTPTRSAKSKSSGPSLLSTAKQAHDQAQGVGQRLIHGGSPDELVDALLDPEPRPSRSSTRSTKSPQGKPAPTATKSPTPSSSTKAATKPAPAPPRASTSRQSPAPSAPVSPAEPMAPPEPPPPASSSTRSSTSTDDSDLFSSTRSSTSTDDSDLFSSGDSPSDDVSSAADDLGDIAGDVGSGAEDMIGGAADVVGDLVGGAVDLGEDALGALALAGLTKRIREFLLEDIGDFPDSSRPTPGSAVELLHDLSTGDRVLRRGVVGLVYLASPLRVVFGDQIVDVSASDVRILGPRATKNTSAPSTHHGST